MRKLILAGLPSTVAAGPALAQTATMDEVGISMPDHAGMTLRCVTVRPADAASTELVGQDVCNNRGG